MLSVSTARNYALKEILSFTYPKLHTGLCWFISFYAFDPAKGAMRRKRIKINSVGTSAEKRRYAAQVCHRLSAKLETGWNPWVEAEADYSYKLFADALNQYRTYINKQLNDGVLRKSTIHGYMSSAGILERWNNESPAPIGYVYQFDRSFCVRFLDYVYLGRGNSPTTRNNNLAFLRSFSTFLVQHLYIKEKPTEGLQRMSKGQRVKGRSVIEPSDMRSLHDCPMAIGGENGLFNRFHKTFAEWCPRFHSPFGVFCEDFEGEIYICYCAALATVRLNKRGVDGHMKCRQGFLSRC